METYNPHRNTTEVRQADRRTANLRVLVISVLVLALVFAAIWGIYTIWPEGGAAT